jgi:dTMP kinase
MGKFIVFEGIDGSGKTTQIKMLAERLKKNGEKVYVTAEPTVSTSGGIIRDALSGAIKRTTCELAALFVWDRINHNINKTNGINKMLADGFTVISDRYYYSSLAYQGEATDYEWVKAMNCSCPEIRKPDLCVFIDVSPNVAIERITSDRATTEIFEEVGKLTRIRETFINIFNDLKDDNVVLINGDKNMEDVSDDVFAEVMRTLGSN